MTIATPAPALTSDFAFLRTCITAMAVVLVAGFVVQLAAGRSSFDAPPVVHVHAVVFMGWVGVTLAQTWLAASGAMALHRQLGRLAVVYSAALLVMGTLVTLQTVQLGRTPFFFQPQHFLIINPLSLVAALGLFWAAVALRRRTDWHTRLQIGAFAALLGPGIGRLAPMPLLVPFAFEIAVLIPLVVPVIGAARDQRLHGRVHPAWVWSIAVMVGVLLLGRLIAFSPAGDAIYAAAFPLAGADGRAFLPPPAAP